MPFSAFFHGERIVSTLCSDEQWEQLAQAARADRNSLTMAYSQLPCLPRVSKLGLRHFYHRPGETPKITWKEAPEHMALKAMVIEAATRAGWEAQTEVPAKDESWIADTLLLRNGVKVAVEIQWSRQSYDDYQFRQQRYDKDGIRCLWLHRHEIAELKHHEQVELPAFRVSYGKGTGKGEVEVGRFGRAHTIPISEFIESALSGELAYTSEIDLWATSCYRCGSGMTLWAEGRPSLWEDNVPLRSDRVRSKLEDAIGAEGYSLPELAKSQRRWSETAKTKYQAFICPACKVLQGDYFVREEWFYADGPATRTLARRADKTTPCGQWVVLSSREKERLNIVTKALKDVPLPQSG